MPATRPNKGNLALAELVRALPVPVGVVGLGVEGRETLRFLRRHGVAEVAVFDRALSAEALSEDAQLQSELDGIAVHADVDWSTPLSACDTIVRSPGIRPDHPAIQAALEAGALLTSATAMFLAACPGPVVGVTGTLGKGTTVSLIETALTQAAVPCRAGGNIGLNPLAFVESLTAETVTVLELSSFQLMGLEGRKPDVAVVLRTSSEHLDWHLDVAEYRAAKRGLLAPSGTGQTVVYCADSAGSCEVGDERLPDALAFSLRGPVENGIGWADGHLRRYRGGQGKPVPALEQLTMPGPFNRENAAAALLAAESIGANPKAAAEAIAAFPGLPHRLERVATLAGASGPIECYNDSYATRPDATLGAVDAFRAEPLALIAGGSEKYADFTVLAEALCRHPTLRRLVLIGQTAGRLADAVRNASTAIRGPEPEIVEAETLDQAVAEARTALPQGGVLLLSPGCASFGMFPNYKVRGERFTALVKSLESTA